MRGWQMAGVTMLGLIAVGCGSGVVSAPAVATPTMPVSGPPIVPTSGPSASGVCVDTSLSCEGAIAAGPHATVAFDHPFTFTTPTGWERVAAERRAYILRASAAPDSEFIVWSHSAPADQPASCDPARKAGIGNTTADWIAYLSAHPAVDITEPVAVDLGAYHAKSVVVTVKDSWKTLCPFNTSPFVILVSDTGNPPTRHHGLPNDGQASMTFVDVGGEAIVIWVDGGKGQPFEQMLAIAEPVAESIRFLPSP